MTNTRPNVVLEGHYSMTEASSLLGVDRKTIYRWRKCGYLKTRSYRHSKMPYVLGRDLTRIYDAYR